MVKLLPSRPYRGVSVDLADVVGGIAGGKLIEQGRRNRGRQLRHHFHTRPDDMRRNRWKATARPSPIGVQSYPRNRES